jgi:uncharacterized protein (DUF2237 family)
MILAALMILLSPVWAHADLTQGQNVLGSTLSKCGDQPKTGFFRNGYCLTGPQDSGTHVACARVTKEFLEYTRTKGNDLITPRRESQFPGLKPGDRWCLCALRWKEAWQAGVAPPLVLEATHKKMLDAVPLHELKGK